MKIFCTLEDSFYTRIHVDPQWLVPKGPRLESGRVFCVVFVSYWTDGHTVCSAQPIGRSSHGQESCLTYS